MKAAKSEVDYSRGHRDSHCGKMDAVDTGYCKHFIERGQKDGQCTEVQGTIGRAMWCKLWSKAKS